MAGTAKERDVWRVAVGIYLYGEDVVLRADEVGARDYSFELDVPALDWETIREDYRNGKCCLSDAQAFVKSWHAVLAILKTIKSDGTYVSAAWINGRGA
jgi:hypothetical protein